MLFSSNVFLFAFLPAVIFIYYVLLRWSRPLQNVFLCIASLFFYAWGEPRFVLVMMLSIAVNWAGGLAVSTLKIRENIHAAKLVLAADIVFNLVIIFIFKYLSFFSNNYNVLIGSRTGAYIYAPEIALPIGISFFTFQAISYVVDVYRGSGEAQKNILNVGLYISFFPQLIAGPIVRYETIADQIFNRKETIDDFTEGVKRFIIGFCKKILIANNVALIADQAFMLNEIGELSVSMAWLGAIAYTLQIFYDFSGYSDMAIGLGRMFGFHFLENFNYPYISKSATEFWRRWHISLGTWFRDYVYIPLGGSRVSKGRHIFNLFVVWLCTGIWHGANWTFILWGLMYFVLLVFERYSGFNRHEGSGASFLKHIYVLFFVVMGWILFRAEALSSAAAYYKACFGLAGNAFADSVFVEYARQNFTYLIAGALFSMPVAKWIRDRIKPNAVTDILYAAVLAFLFLASISFLVKGSYNPFIYFNF